MIVGLVGKMASGKGEIAKHLKAKGFGHYIYSDVLREIAKRRNIPPTRENLQRLGADIKRESKNQGILSKKLLERIKEKNAVVDGIRAVDEIKELKAGREVYIIGVTAPQRTRYKRIMKRSREGDPKTFSEFKRLDNIENRGKTEGQEITKCLKIADFLINNNSSIEKLKNEVDKIICPISS